MEGDAIKRLLAAAEAEIGYLEKETKDYLDDKILNAGDENITKYARDMDSVSWFYNGRKQGVAWCDVFVDWCFVQAFGAENARLLLCQPKKSSGAGCNSSMGYYKKAGQFYAAPAVGDQIFFWSSEDPSKAGHTGIVKKITANRVYTIEGNTSGASSSVVNGGGVAEKNYTLGYGRIAGYGRPDWSLVENQIDNGGGNTNMSYTAKVMSYTAKVTAQSGKTVNMRESASDSAKIIYKVPIGATVYTEGTQGKYTRCTYEAPEYIYTGYMQTKFLQEVPDESPATPSDDGEYITIKKADLLAVYDLLDKLLYGEGAPANDPTAVG